MSNFNLQYTSGHAFFNVIRVMSMLNSSQFCTNYKRFSKEFCDVFDTNHCVILKINENKCYQNVCFCAHQKLRDQTTIYYELKHHSIKIMNDSAFPTWVTDVSTIEDDDISPLPFIIVSICCALCGLCVVLSGIQFYHKYVGYNIIEKGGEADATNQHLLK